MRPKKKSPLFAWLSVLLLLIILAMLFWRLQHKSKTIGYDQQTAETTKILPESYTHDTATVGVNVDSVAIESGHADSTNIQNRRGPEKVRPETRQVLKTYHKNLATPGIRMDTTSSIITSDTCGSDTSVLWVYPDPSGGLHRSTVSVVFVPSRPCSIFFRLSGDDTTFTAYTNVAVVIESTTTLIFRAVDSCGRAMEVRHETYEILRGPIVQNCPGTMEYVEVGESRYCIDRYEWPNRKGAQPKTYISLYQAMDSCASAGKRLCTLDEWRIACAGPYGWKYPYSDRYEQRACVTTDTIARTTGSHRECRGYFDVYDMSGNVAEWTSTRSTENPQFYMVSGGFWESGAQSGCFDVRYSYFPQNRHNPVGFRCCADARPKTGGAHK